jgi:murein DD-endopeptidase MepM/ murein hydrolase activator NlpD
MSSVVELVRSWPLPRVLALAVIASGTAGCSSEVARFDSNPYASTNQTASVQQQRAPAGQVQTSSLPPPAGSDTATMPAAGGQGMASYHPSHSGDPASTATVPARQAQSPHSLPPPIQRSASRAAPAQNGVHIVAPGETLTRIARHYSMSLTDLAKLNNIAPHTKVSIGDRLNIPASRVARATKTEAPQVAKALSAPAKAKAEPKTVAKAQPKAAPVLASHQPTETAAIAGPATDAPTTSNPVRAGNASLSFRWPAKGRIIAGFGPKTNGQSNDGINIALPEGTPIKAAEDGVVAYAGNELKGYGNLVLVRHADGYVTAYAHAKELLVKRGDPIKRGQTIARSGQTGNIDAPQLHFEIRKGPAPIDPMPHLSGG